MAPASRQRTSMVPSENTTFLYVKCEKESYDLIGPRSRHGLSVDVMLHIEYTMFYELFICPNRYGINRKPPPGTPLAAVVCCQSPRSVKR